MNLSTRSRRLLSFLIIVILITPLAAQEEPVVREIVIRGLKNVEKKEVLDVMRTRVGERSSPEMRREDIRSIYTLGYFSEDIRFYREELEDGIRIIVSLEENPVIRDIVIVGNSEISSSRIMSELPFETGDILPAGARVKARNEIREIYSDSGYKKATVKIRVDEVEEKNAAIVTVIIDEGKKILIKDLALKGNENYSSFRLRFLLDNKGSWGFIRNYYDETTFDDDLETLRDFYRNRGYLDVVVKRGKPEYNEKKGWIRPVIIIEEGPRYRVEDIRVKNAAIFTREEIISCFEDLKGDYFSAGDYRKGMKKLKKLYGDEGYIQMQVRPDFQKIPGGDAVDIELDINENNRIYVGKIKVRRRGFQRGEPETSFEKFYDKVSPPPEDEVVQREVILEPEQPYRSFQEVRSVERLKRLDIFDEVFITREPTEQENVRDAVVNVKEGNTGFLVFGVGYGESPGAYFQVRVTERNLFGDARDLRLKALIGTKLSAVHLSYLDRYFRDTDMSFEWDLYRDRFARNEYSERIYGSTVELGKPLSEYVKGYVRTRLEHVNFFDEDDDIVTELDSYAVASVRGKIVEDRRDDVWWPTKGFRRGAGLELGYADGTLAKLTFQHSWYKQFYKDMIYAMNFSGGLLPYDADEIGITERFFLGGGADLRGFSYRGAGPKDPGDDDMALGGSTKLLLKNEIRYPLYKDLKGVFFVDAGMLDETVGLNTPRVSAGAGFRLKISIIRLYIDFAEALNEKEDDDTQFFHFRLGAAF